MSGNPDYDKYAHEQFERQTKRGIGSYHRAHTPSLSDLSESENNTLRKLETMYDRYVNGGHSDIYKRMLNKIDKKNVDTLFGLGFIRIEKNGRIIPSFIRQEHVIKIGGREFRI
jgi:hypothetical protein